MGGCLSATCHLPGAEGCFGKWGGVGEMANHSSSTHPACLWPGSMLREVPTFFHCTLTTALLLGEKR